MNAATVEFHALRIFLSLILWPATFSCLGVQHAVAQADKTSAPPSSQPIDDQSRRSWQIGGFVAGGFPPAYEIHNGTFRFNEELDFFNAGAIAGKTLTDPHGPRFLRGSGEAVVEVIPFWLAYYPKQTLKVNPDDPNQFALYATVSAYSNHGISITPLLFRWNFGGTQSKRFVPWFQLGSGLLWTGQNFPQGKGPGAETSRINFTPQIGFGESIFTKKNQSLDLALKVVHISSAGLGEYNPGVNLTLQFSLGYSWWK
jgi:lipid A 3-O-deacylase